MEENTEIEEPSGTEENNIQEDVTEITTSKRLETMVKNSFLSRGCCHEPHTYQPNDKLNQRGCAKLEVFNYLNKINPPRVQQSFDCVEVRFKNSRKDFYRLPPDSDFEDGDIVALEASPGHDIGIITLTGELARMQMKKKGVNPESEEIKKVYRRARLTDVEKWISAVEHEEPALQKTKNIASSINLHMKMNDVEYQGDGTKAIFYYTADERVDFRELIKLLAEEFRVRIEMRQIGVRQEAARLGGIGTCGRELCCSTWLTDFKSVTTNAARIQQLSLNPQKLAGQCSKLKCCLNYEYDTYVDALKDFPSSEIILKTKKGQAIHQKTDIFQKIMWYSYTDELSHLMAIPVDSVREIIKLNNKNNFPEKLEDFAFIKETKTEFESSVGQDDLNRFDD